MLQERSLFEATNWLPVYMRALNLVTALVSHSCPNTRKLGFDFLYQHEKFICDIFEFVSITVFPLKKSLILVY